MYDSNYIFFDYYFQCFYRNLVYLLIKKFKRSHLSCTLCNWILCPLRKISFTSSRARSIAGPQRSRSNGESSLEAIRTPTLYLAISKQIVPLKSNIIMPRIKTMVLVGEARSAMNEVGACGVPMLSTLHRGACPNTRLSPYSPSTGNIEIIRLTLTLKFLNERFRKST